MLNKKIIFVVLAILWMLTLASCVSTDSKETLVVENDADILASRVTYKNEVIAINSSSVNNKVRSSVPDEEPLLTLVAEVSPPSFDDITLQATEVIIKGNKAYVSYNVAGETMSGALEVFEINDANNPTLISSLIFMDTDVNGIAVHGNELYFAGASESMQAMFAKVTIVGGRLTSDIRVIDLPGYAGTDVDVSGSHVYVTSGDDAGISIFSRPDLTLDSFHAIADARGVDVDESGAVVVYGTDAGIITFDSNTGALLNDFSLTGATIPESKSTVEVKKGKAVLALGDGGTQIVCAASGDVIHKIDTPIVDGLDASLTVTNSATAYKTALFMANGEAGAYIALSVNSFSNNGCDVGDVTLLGKLQLGESESVNHVLYRNSSLFIASGNGGLKILNVSLDADVVDTDDLGVE